VSCLSSACRPNLSTACPNGICPVEDVLLRLWSKAGSYFSSNPLFFVSYNNGRSSEGCQRILVFFEPSPTDSPFEYNVLWNTVSKGRNLDRKTWRTNNPLPGSIALRFAFNATQCQCQGMARKNSMRLQRPK
jgi:hypothetical protein